MTDTPDLSAYRRRRMVSALWWMLVPGLLLLPFRNSGLAVALCGPMPNLSYDAMLIAAGFGLGLAHLVLALRRGDHPDRAAGSALDWLDLLLMGSLAALYAFAGIYGSALAWAIGLAISGATLAGQSEAERTRKTAMAAARPVVAITPVDWIARLVLVLLALVFLAFPVSQPWTGPVEPFVRWHPFSPALENVWRGIFASFAVAMLLASRDPGGRHRSFMLALGLSGICHATLMGADNLISAWAGTANGNPEHLYGDVAGWMAIGLLSLSYWLIRQPSRRGIAQSGMA